MRARERVNIFVVELMPDASKYKLRCWRGVLPIFDRHAGQIVGVEGNEIDCRCIVGGVHKRCATSCNGISNADLIPHEEVSLGEVRDLACTTIMRRIARNSAPQEVAVA